MQSFGIVGANGFIGGHLASRFSKVRRYVRSNLAELENDESDVIIIAAAPATKWVANSDPAKDLSNIKKLIDSIRCIGNKKCILISTIDVFPGGITFSESNEILNDHPEGYGANRGYLEKELSKHLGDLHIVRLPGMFGPGLKKNLIYDLINDISVQNINRESTFQFYDVRSLPSQLTLILELGLEITNLATEPISVSEIYSACFNLDAPEIDVPILNYRMQTIYSEQLAGRLGPYLLSKQEVLSGMQQWISSMRILT